MVEWLAKYSPKQIPHFVGPQGTPSSLVKWLTEWKPNARFKSVLLTGPTGCGKTCLARLACTHLGMTNILELNCVNKRTKKTIDALRDAFLSKPVLSFVTRKDKARSQPTAVIIDEIDACDQGGLPELLKCIRMSKVPVICIAGDAYNKSLVALKTNSFVLRMLRPSVDQVAAHLMYIAKMETLNPPLSHPAAKSLAAACNCDVRQSILELYVASRSGTLVLARNEEGMLCDRQLGAFEVIPKLFPPRFMDRVTGKPRDNPSLFSTADRLYHADRSMVPLMVGENYHKAIPLRDDLEGLMQAADSISTGNVLEGGMIRYGAWDIAEQHAYFSTTRPCVISGGPLGGQADFPNILANMTKARKQDKSIIEFSRGLTASCGGSVSWTTKVMVSTELLHAHGSKFVGMFARICAAAPQRIGAAADSVAEQMTFYNLEKIHWDWLAASWTRAPVSIPPAAKAALTKAFNARSKSTTIIRNIVGGKRVVMTESRDNDDVSDVDMSDDDDIEVLPLKRQRI